MKGWRYHTISDRCMYVRPVSSSAWSKLILVLSCWQFGLSTHLNLFLAGVWFGEQPSVICCRVVVYSVRVSHCIASSALVQCRNNSLLPHQLGRNVPPSSTTPFSPHTCLVTVFDLYSKTQTSQKFTLIYAQSVSYQIEWWVSSK